MSNIYNEIFAFINSQDNSKIIADIIIPNSNLKLKFDSLMQLNINVI
jgi:hypothetical protein